MGRSCIEKTPAQVEVETFINQRILELCHKRGISRYQLCMKTGVAQSSISTTVHGKNNLSMKSLLLVCEGLGVSPAEFFAPEAQDNKLYYDLSTEEKQLLENWKKMTRKQRKAAHEFLQQYLAEAEQSKD